MGQGGNRIRNSCLSQGEGSYPKNTSISGILGAKKYPPCPSAHAGACEMRADGHGVALLHTHHLGQGLQNTLQPTAPHLWRCSCFIASHF